MRMDTTRGETALSLLQRSAPDVVARWLRELAEEALEFRVLVKLAHALGWKAALLCHASGIGLGPAERIAATPADEVPRQVPLAGRVVRALGDGSRWGVSIQYVEQEEMLGIAHAVSRLENHVDRPFFLFLGDIFFVTENLGAMLDRFQKGKLGGVLACKREPNLEAIKRNFVVLTDAQGTFAQILRGDVPGPLNLDLQVASARDPAQAGERATIMLTSPQRGDRRDLGNVVTSPR